MPLDRACEELIRGVSSGWLNGSRGLLLATSWMTDRAHRAKTAGEGENARFARPGTTRRYSQWTAPRFSLCSCVLPLRARAIGEEVAGPDPHRRSPPPGYIPGHGCRRPDGREVGGRTVMVAPWLRGKSGLHRAGCQVTPGCVRRELHATDSATESKPPSSQEGGKGERVG